MVGLQTQDCRIVGLWNNGIVGSGIVTSQDWKLRIVGLPGHRIANVGLSDCCRIVKLQI